MFLVLSTRYHDQMAHCDGGFYSTDADQFPYHRPPSDSWFITGHDRGKEFGEVWQAHYVNQR